MDFTETVLTSISGVGLALELLAMIGRRLGWRWIRLISPVMRNDGRLWLIWPWQWGVYPGHWWWPWAAPEDAWRWLVGASVLVVAADVHSRVTGYVRPKWVPFTIFVLGVAAGAACWAMGY